VIVEALVETLGFRQIGVIGDEYAVSRDGMKMFGVLDLATGFEGCRFSIGVRNSHDKSFRLAVTVGVRLWGAHHNLTRTKPLRGIRVGSPVQREDPR